MFIELLHLFLWDGVALLVPNGKVHGVWTEQGGSSHTSVAVCVSHVKNCWPSEDHSRSLCLTHSLVVELLEILSLQLVHACAHRLDRPWPTVLHCEAVRSAREWYTDIQHADVPESYLVWQNFMIQVQWSHTLEECLLKCLCTCYNEPLLYVHSSGGISEEIPLWNGEWCHQIQTQKWVSQGAHTCTCLQHWFLTSSSDVPSLFWCFNIAVTPPSYWFYFLVLRVYKPRNY